MLAYEHLTKTGSRTFLLLFGGSAPGVCFNDIWLLDVSDYLLSSGSVEAGPVCIDSSTAPTRSCVWKCAKWLSEGGTSVICGRSGQSASLIGDILYIIGTYKLHILQDLRVDIFPYVNLVHLIL